jgi:hypothetical protein
MGALWPLLVVVLLPSPARGVAPSSNRRLGAATRFPATRHRCVTCSASSGGEEPPAEMMSRSQATFNLVKNVVGTGVLTLPSGVARLSDGGASSLEVMSAGVSRCE